VVALGFRPDRFPLRWWLAWTEHGHEIYDEYADVIGLGVARGFGDGS
jgi:hypothetical protein